MNSSIFIKTIFKIGDSVSPILDVNLKYNLTSFYVLKVLKNEVVYYVAEVTNEFCQKFAFKPEELILNGDKKERENNIIYLESPFSIGDPVCSVINNRIKYIITSFYLYSTNNEDVNFYLIECADMNANKYAFKPFELTHFLQTINQITTD